MKKVSPAWKPVLVLLLLTACAKQNSDDASSSYSQPEPFPYFGTSTSFAVLSAQGVSNDGTSTIYGDVGVSPSSNMVGISLAKRTGGADHINDSIAIQAEADSMKAYGTVKSKSCDQDLSGQDLGGMTLSPGTYCFSNSAQLNGLLTLDAKGDVNSNFIFKVSTDFEAGINSGIRMLNGGETCNVFWQIAGTASLDAGANVMGAFLTIGNITLNTGVKLNGKLSSQAGTIQIHSSEIYNNFCPWNGGS